MVGRSNCRGGTVAGYALDRQNTAAYLGYTYRYPVRLPSRASPRYVFFNDELCPLRVRRNLVCFQGWQMLAQSLVRSSGRTLDTAFPSKT